jgi:phage terminase large subunit-like protein
MGARRQPLNLAITTAGTYDTESIGWQKHEYGQRVLDGDIEDDSFFAFICAIDEDDDPLDPSCWGKANPNLGVSVKLDDMEQQAATAKNDPSFYNDFLRLRLNRWTQQITRWLSIEKWQESTRSRRSRRWRSANGARKALHGCECFAGLDLSSKIDLTALVLAFPARRRGSS